MTTSRTRLATVAAALLSAALAGCASFGPPATPVGEMSGTLQIEWAGADRFIYRPLASDPLVYVSGERRIEPGAMYTDGGSIPRIFWSARGLSPWTYGPAYILHDWLFNEHRCGREPGYDFAQANAVLYDAIAILQRDFDVVKDPEPPRLIKAAVDRFGRNAWERGGCNAPPPASPGFRSARSAGGVIVGVVKLGRSR